MWFFQNPEIIFYLFFRIFNLDIFWVLILQKSIGMWFFQNPEIIFYLFFRIFNLDISESISKTLFKQSDWLKIRNGRGFLIYSAGQGLNNPGPAPFYTV